jgi:hypothetical protein
MRIHTLSSALALAAALATAPTLAHADVKMMWESPAASVSQTVGITDVTIKYHRPGVKGREIWGKLVPFGQVWRAGANEATTISFSTPVKIAGKDVPAGTYALFVLLASKEKWTFILAKNPEQWGAFSYKPDQDVLRLDATPAAAATPREWLAYELDPTGKNTLTVSLVWEKVRASFPIEIDVDKLYQAHLAEELPKAEASNDVKQKSQAYLVAARYWVTRGEKLDEAAKLLDKSEKAAPSFWVNDVRARLYAKQGKTKEALAQLDKAKAGASGKMPKEYIDMLDGLRAEWTAPKKK